MKSLTLTAIDVGTYGILGVTARKDLRTGQVEVLARSACSCLGVRNGEVVKPQQVGRAISNVKEDLSQKSGQRIKEVVTNIGGRRLFSRFSQGLVSVSRADQRISREDVQRVMRAAKAVNLSSNKDILIALPKEFIIDGEPDIKEPLGLQGIRLEAKVLLICHFSPVLDNLQKAFSEADLDIVDVFLSPLAAARAVLTQEQKEVGVALLDIGAGTTSLAVFEKGDLVDFAILPVGAANITNDIALGLRTEIKTAERIKKEFASLAKSCRGKKVSGKNSPTKKSHSKSRAERVIIPEKNLCFAKSYLGSIVEARLNQIFCEAQKSLKKISAPEQLPAGLVLTGGGAYLPGIVEFVKQSFKLPCSLGTIREIPSLDECGLSGCAGLLLCGFDAVNSGEAARMSSAQGLSGGLKEKLKRLFRAFLP